MDSKMINFSVPKTCHICKNPFKIGEAVSFVEQLVIVNGQATMHHLAACCTSCASSIDKHIKLFGVDLFLLNNQPDERKENNHEYHSVDKES